MSLPRRECDLRGLRALVSLPRGESDLSCLRALVSLPRGKVISGVLELSCVFS